MPKPHPIRDKFLKYMRRDLAHGKPWVDTAGVYTADEVRLEIRKVSETDQLIYRILDYYLKTRMARMKIAEQVHYDASTVKRKLDEAVDLILHRLHDRRRVIPADDERFKEA